MKNGMQTFAVHVSDALAGVRRINKLMGTMTQLIVILNQYHIRVALRLVECQVSDRSTVGAAADHLKTLSSYALSSIERYFGRVIEEDEGEGQPEAPAQKSIALQ